MRLIKIILEAVAVWLPRSVINRCPATIFAMSRTDRVIGRIRLLIDSIKTINGMRAPGVPEGTICANMWEVLLIQPKIMKVSHRGRARPRVNVICLEEVKTYGKSPIKLLIKMKVNRAISIIVSPLEDGWPSRVLNSLCRVFFRPTIVVLIFEGTTQYSGAIKKKMIRELSQLNEIFMMVEGSKLENRLVIIFK